MNKRQFKKIYCVVEFKGVQVRSQRRVPPRFRKDIRRLFLGKAKKRFDAEVQQYMESNWFHFALERIKTGKVWKQGAA